VSAVILVMFTLLIILFIFGMTLLRRGLFHLSGDSLKIWLTNVTDAPWKGLLAGILVTSILQSSSAVMIIVIGLISAKMLTFNQSIGIILGTNIGTTVTAELITYDIESLLLPLLFIAVPLLFTRKPKLHNFGLIILGISFVFTAMSGFELLTEPLKKYGLIEQLLYTLDNNYFFSILAGTIITGIIQSSTATTGIIMGFLSSGDIHIDTGIAIMLGSNIGTCVDALLASLGGGKEAKLTAYAHIWLNVIGVACFFPFIGLLAEWGTVLADSVDVQLAHISVLFNVICSLMVLPFANPFAKMILKLHRKV
jgi:phosphate:Na+ symporter